MRCGVGRFSEPTSKVGFKAKARPGEPPTVAEIVAAIPISSNAQAAPPLRDGLRHDAINRATPSPFCCRASALGPAGRVGFTRSLRRRGLAASLGWHRSSEASRRLDDIPGVGPALATALVATVADPRAFRSGRNFSAWIGLVPKQHSSGGKDRLGSISKRGDRYLRFLFVAGALAVIRYAKIHGTKHRPWLTALLARRHTKVAAIALANKIARMAWAIMAKGEHYKEPVALAA